MKTAITKGRDGWEARSDVPMTGDTINEGDQFLSLATYKSGKELVTRAAVYVKTDCGFSFVVCQDYMKTVTKSAARCTEKSVQIQHEATLADIDTILADVRAFYEKKEATV